MAAPRAELDTETAAALEVARDLARHGVPIFLARPATDEEGTWLPDGGHGGCGYWLPPNWQATGPDPAAVDQWCTGLAIAAVMGVVVDGCDVDPRNSGNATADAMAAAGVWPRSLGRQSTPSGGWHDLVNRLGVASRDGVAPGVDVKAGLPDGTGRGFLWIAPTVKLSKATGEIAVYRWTTRPMLDELDDNDDTGAALAERINALRADVGDDEPDTPHEAHEAMSDAQRAAVGRYLAAVVRSTRAELAEAATWPEGRRDERGRGWQKLTADACNRFGRLARADWTGWGMTEARAQLETVVPDVIARSVGLGATWCAQKDRRGPAPYPATLAADEWLYGLPSAQEVAPAPAEAEPTELAEEFGYSVARTDNVAHEGVVLDDVYLDRTGKLSDAAQADELANHLRGRYRWTPADGWLAWTGKYWRVVDTPVVMEEIRRYQKRVVKGAIDRGADQEAIRALLALLARSKAVAIELSLRGIEGIHTDPTDLDAHPDLLNVANGIVNLRTGELGPHDPDALLTKCARAAYIPGATHRDWHTALECLPVEVADYLQIRAGQGITGHPTPDDIMPILEGGGGNGKSTVLAGFQVALGDGYCTTVPERVLLANPSDHPTEKMTLRGARLAFIEELPEGAFLNTKRLKDLVGTTKMEGRWIRRDSVTWDATHSLMLTTNHPPRVRETDEGTWRRLQLIVFDTRYRQPHEALEGPNDRRGDPNLRPRIQLSEDNQGEAVLAWLVEGARRWYAAGKIMPPPPKVREDTRRWRIGVDLLSAYIEDRLVFEPQSCVLTRELHADFNDWQQKRGHSQWSDQTLTERIECNSQMVSHAVEKKRPSKVANLSRPYPLGASQAGAGSRPHVWIGVRFRTEEDKDPDETQDADQVGNPLDRGGPGYLVNSQGASHGNVNEHPRSTPVQPSGQAPERRAVNDAASLASLPQRLFTPTEDDGSCSTCGGPLEELRALAGVDCLACYEWTAS